MDYSTEISALGSIGEFIGSIGVIASVIYLAFQIRQNTRQLQRSEINSTLEQANAVRQAQLDRHTAELLAKVVDSPDTVLSTEEKLRLNAYFAMEMWQHYNNWDRIRQGIIQPGSYNFAAFVRSFFRNRATESWWESNRSFFEHAFVDAVEAARRASREAPTRQ